jgi:hypothetical protein
MQTTYEFALNEFRDASAAVRRAFGAVAEARELQIIADSQHRQACNDHAEAVRRLETADLALMDARSPAAPTPTPTPTPTPEPRDDTASASSISRLFASDPAANGLDNQPLSIG